MYLYFLYWCDMTHDLALVPILLAYANARLLSRCGGVQILLQHIIQCHDSPRINEALIQTLFHLLNNPQSRQDSSLANGLDVCIPMSIELYAQLTICFGWSLVLTICQCELFLYCFHEGILIFLN